MQQSHNIYFNSTAMCSLNSFSLSEVKNKILRQFDFKNAVRGTPVFFRQINTILQYGISEAQKIFHETFYDVTHAGLVVNATDHKICLAEAVREGVKESCYFPDRLIKEELCFPFVKSNLLYDLSSDIAGKIIEKPLKYNLPGALLQFLTPKMFTFQQKKALIKTAIRYLIGENPANSKKSYFCSELSLEINQVARLLQKNTQLKELVHQEMSQVNPQIIEERGKLLRWIMQKLDVDAIWKNVATDPLFAAPARATSPADLCAMQLESNPLICVSSPHPTADPCQAPYASEAGCLQYIAVQMLDRYFKREELPENELQTFISTLSKITSYSPKTLRCFFQQSHRHREDYSNDLVQCLTNIAEQCLDSTLSWPEKINVFLVSRALSQAVDRLIEDPSLLDQLQSENNAVVEAAAKTLFPITPWKTMYWIKNIQILLALQNKDSSYLYKYIPIGLLYDRSIFEKISIIGNEKIYSTLEKFTSLDHQVFKCLHKYCNLKMTMPCALTCLGVEKHAVMEISSTIHQEVEKILKNPSEYIVQNILNQTKPSQILLKAHGAHQVDVQRTLDPKDPSYYREIFLPIALLAFVGENLENIPLQIDDLLSYDNILDLLNNQEIRNRAIDGAMLWYLSRLTSYNKNSLECIKRDCSVLQAKSIEECIEHCIRPHLTKKEKKDFLNFKNNMDSMSEQTKEGEGSIFEDNNIKSIIKNANSKEFLFKSLPMYLVDHKEQVTQMLALSKNEWDEKPLKEKLIFFLHLAYPKTYSMIKLMNPENAKLVMEEYEIWKKIIDYIGKQRSMNK